MSIRWLKLLKKTYLAERKLGKKVSRLVGFTELEALVNFYISPAVLGGDEGLVRPEAIRVRVKSLENENRNYQPRKIIRR